MTPPCAWSTPLQKTFTSFPSGSVGAALLVLRSVVGSIALGDAALAIGAGLSPVSFFMAMPAVIASLMLLPGFMVPVASALLAIEGAALLCFGASPLVLLDSRIALFEFVVMAAALAVLGPGAASFDARLFGRREVAIDDGRGERVP
jgi:hypothetical protein